MKAALIAAVVAAIVSASAATAATAVVITGAQIKDGSIQVKDLSRKARISLRGQRGPRGPAGIPGPEGVPGVNGGFDPNKVSYVQGPTTSIPPDTVTRLSVDCPAGTKVIAGGYYASIGSPFSDHQVGSTNWSVGIETFGWTITGSGYAFATCAAP